MKIQRTEKNIYDRNWKVTTYASTKHIKIAQEITRKGVRKELQSITFFGDDILDLIEDVLIEKRRKEANDGNI